MGDVLFRRARSPALAPPKTIRPARPGGSNRFGAFGLLSSTSSPTASKPRRALASGLPSGRSSRVLERLTAAIPENERPPVAAPIASDRPTVSASDDPTTAILPDDAGWCESRRSWGAAVRRAHARRMPGVSDRRSDGGWYRQNQSGDGSRREERRASGPSSIAASYTRMWRFLIDTWSDRNRPSSLACHGYPDRSK
jgi:hypothetical protein